MTKKKLKDVPLTLETEHKINAVEVPAKNTLVKETSVVDEHVIFERDTQAGKQSDGGGQSAILLVTCHEGAEVFVGGKNKGKVGGAPLIISVTPGRHLVIVSHSKGMDWNFVKFKAGATVSVTPGFCNH